MTIYRYTPGSAEERIINDLVDQETLLKRVPRLATFYEGVEEMRSLQAEISTLGSITRKSGFTPGKDFQRIASIPYSVAAAIVEIDPEFFRDKGKVYRFLQAHPEYDVRTLVK